MGQKLVSRQTLLGMLRAELQGRTHISLALELGVSNGFLSLVLAGKRSPGSKIPAYFDLKPITLYGWKPKQ